MHEKLIQAVEEIEKEEDTQILRSETACSTFSHSFHKPLKLLGKVADLVEKERVT